VADSANESAVYSRIGSTETNMTVIPNETKLTGKDGRRRGPIVRKMPDFRDETNLPVKSPRFPQAGCWQLRFGGAIMQTLLAGLH
jgi:hypothetical protein